MEVSIQDIAYDSRQVKPHSLFVALRGQNFDGHRFISEAQKKGATAFVVEDLDSVPEGTPALQVKNTRQALPQISHVFFEKPSENLSVIGITGTNGKTTLSYILEDILRDADQNPGITGTINCRFGNQIESTPLTTLESLDYQRLLSKMVQNNVSHVISEVSSHSLVMHRCDAIAYNIGVFTNLTRDHLEYHGDMENYFQAKSILFKEHLAHSSKKNKAAVLNFDDDFGRRLAKEISFRVISFGIKEKSGDFSVLKSHCSREGFRAQLNTPQGKKRN